MQDFGENEKMSVQRWAFNFTKWEPTLTEMLLATSCIQKEEKERLNRFVFKKDFKSSLIGRLMMRKFVSESCQLKYDKIKFVRDERGKPLLSENIKGGVCKYNVSHQGDFTIFAGCRDDDDFLLGVDVVKTELPKSKNLDEYFRIMRRTFTDKEWDTIKGEAHDFSRLQMFSRHWCLKESYVKAVGIGLNINLQDVSFKINTNILKKDEIVDDTEVFFKNEKLPQWQFQEVLLDDDHCVAVATNKKQPKILFKEVSFDYVCKNAVPFMEQDLDYCKSFFFKNVTNNK